MFPISDSAYTKVCMSASIEKEIETRHKRNKREEQKQISRCCENESQSTENYGIVQRSRQ